MLICDWYRAHAIMTIGQQIDDNTKHRSVCPTALPLPGETITKELRTEGKGHAKDVEGAAGLSCVCSDRRRTALEKSGTYGLAHAMEPEHTANQQIQLTSTSALRTIGRRSSSFTGSPVASGMPRCARTARLGGGRR